MKFHLPKFDFSKLFASFRAFFVKPKVEVPVATTPLQPAPDKVSVVAPTPKPVLATDGQVPTFIQKILGETPETDAILNSRVAQNSNEVGPKVTDPGPNLDAVGTPKTAQYKAGETYTWFFQVPCTQFDISDCVGSTATSATVIVKDKDGKALVGPVQANPKMWNCHFVGGVSADVVMDKDGPGIATIYA